MEKEIYLISKNYNTKIMYKVSRETNCFYFIKYNNVCEQKIPKKTMRTGSGYDTTHWRIATEEDMEYFLKIRILNDVKRKMRDIQAEKITIQQAQKLRDIINSLEV